MAEEIDSISLNPDAVMKMTLRILAMEKQLAAKSAAAHADESTETDVPPPAVRARHRGGKVGPRK